MHAARGFTREIADRATRGAKHLCHRHTRGLRAATCTLDLPPPGGALNLPAQVVWCTVTGRKGKVGSGSHLLSRSSLRFTALTGAQHAALAWLLSTSYRQQQSAA